jgi:hypothetical protein
MAQTETERKYTLEEREYRDAEGNVHHHTHKWMERHRPHEREASPLLTTALLLLVAAAAGMGIRRALDRR